jgi:esterase/lipase superfamily enzyme
VEEGSKNWPAHW